MDGVFKYIPLSARMVLDQPRSFLLALASGPTVLVSSSKPIKALLKEHKGEDIPAEYFILSKRLFFYEHLINTLFLIIIALMITKPF